MSQKTAVKSYKRDKIMPLDVVLLVIMVFLALLIVVPMVNVLAISFATQKEYLDTPLLLIPTRPTIDAYRALFNDGRIWIGC